MKPIKAIKTMLILGVALGLAACTAGPQTTRNAPMFAKVPAAVRAPVVTPANDVRFTVSAVKVSVPRYLRVSESNLLYPIGADIVWHGDPYGNRYEQVKAIFEEGIGRGVKDMHGNRKVVAEIVVKRFHALSQSARYLTGGIHSISFLLTLRDPKTGEVVMGPHVIKADLIAYGGARAVAAEDRGLTQKVRITAHLAQVIRAELSPPYESSRRHVINVGTKAGS